VRWVRAPPWPAKNTIRLSLARRPVSSSVTRASIALPVARSSSSGGTTSSKPSRRNSAPAPSASATALSSRRQWR
jgi:hypothetical protein